VHTNLEPFLIADQGRRLSIAPGQSIIGRDGDATIHIADHTVGQRHAELVRTGSAVAIADLGSRNGTYVNEQTVPRGIYASLRDGDTVRVGSTSLRYAAPSSSSFTVRDQHAEDIYMAENLYIQQQQQQRESFLRQVAASRTRARRLILFGFILAVVGFGAYVAMVLRFVADVDRSVTTGEVPTQGFDSYGLIGFAVALVGVVMMIVGIVRHVVASSRQRQALFDPAWTMRNRRGHR
jgi:hypothetical protein